MVVFDDVEPLEKIKIFDKGVEFPAYTDTFGDFQCSYRYGDVTVPNIKLVEPLRQECEHFLECIETHSQPITSGVTGLKVVRILEAAQASLANDHHREVIHW